MTISTMQKAIDALLDAAATAADPTRPVRSPADGGWNAEQILAHVCLVNALTLETAHAVVAGGTPVYDNRHAQDPWTIDRQARRAGGPAGLAGRIRAQGAMLSLLDDLLGVDELATPVPALLLSNNEVLVDQQVPLADLIAGLAEQELPGHTVQILALTG